MKAKLQCEAITRGEQCKRKPDWIAPTFYGGMAYLCKNCVHEHGSSNWRNRAQSL